MKPLNLDNKPCSPVSSNCIVWQGPDIECIEICTGDTISDVVANLATELCTILDQTNVSNYDLSCLNIVNCGPTDFQALIQLLIEKICELQNITPESSGSSSNSCPDCIVTVASCFIEDGATTMQFLDYVQMIASKVCALIDEIGQLQTQITNLDNRVTILEEKDTPTFTLPSILVDCTLSTGNVVAGNAYSIDVVLESLVNDDDYGYCALLGSTGLPVDLLSAVATQCIDGSSLTLTKGTSFASEYLGTWVNSPLTVADAITNLWLVVCDTYEYLNGVSFPVSIVTAGENITVTDTVVGSTTTYEVSGKDTIVTSIDASVTVGSVTVGETTTYDLSVSPTKVFSVQGQPANLNKVAPVLNTSRLCDGDIQINTNILEDDFGAGWYNMATGVFTFQEDGVYEISFFQHMTIDDGEGWYGDSGAGVPIPVANGVLTAGITSPTGCNFLCINNCTIVQEKKHISINGSFTRSLNRTDEIALKVINVTARDYITQGGDTSRLTIVKIRD
jgi:hypothetical protein